MPNPLTFFLDSVAAILHERRMSKSDLARKMNVTPTSVNRYLGGANTPGIDKVGEIADALSVEPFYLLMSPDERAKWDSLTNPRAPKAPAGSSYREKLIAAALALDEQYAKLLAELAEKRLESLAGSAAQQKHKAQK